MDKRNTKRIFVRNIIQCKHCGDILESTYTHDYQECSCGACAVDGGHEYLRRCYTGQYKGWRNSSTTV